MSLRGKVLSFYLLAVVAMAVVGYAAARLIVLRSFADLETQAARQNVDRALNALSNEVATLDTFAEDWAVWDDTYAFIENGNEEYIRSNLVDETFIHLRLNVMLYVRSSGEPGFAKAFDLNTQREVTVPMSLLQRVSANDPLIRLVDPERPLSGIVLTPEGLMVAATRPILPSNGDGPVRGALLMAKYLDGEELERLATIAVLSLAMHRLDDPTLPADFAAVRPLLSVESTVAVRPLSGEAIGGYAVLTDIYGEPGVLLRIDMPRDIYQQGETTTLYFVIALVAAGVIFIVSLSFHLDRLVLSRLARLDAEVNRISQTGDPAARVVVSGNDELAHLAQATNRMLQALEQSHNAVKEVTARYSRLFEEVQAGVLVIDVTSHMIIDANPAAIRMLGASRETVIGAHCSRFCQNEDERCFDMSDEEVVWRSEGELRKANGESVPVMKAASSIMLEGRRHLLESVVDISERKKREKRLTYLAFHDPLTGVANRHTLEDALQDVLVAARDGTPGALLLLDLDNFKPVNDRIGHAVGDEVLVRLTQIIPASLRSSDLLARLGGDEFVALLENTTLEQARDIAERICRTVETTDILIGENALRLTASIGVIAIDGRLSARELMANVDLALYEAKERGRNRVVVHW